MKPRTGNLVKRGSVYYLRYTVDGKVIVRRLLDQHEKPVSTIEAAEKLRAQFMAPLRVADRKTALETIATRIGGVEAELAKIKDDAPALKLADAWVAFVAARTKREVAPTTLESYECEFGHFTKWMTSQHPKVVEMRHVDFPIAEEYCNHLIARNLSGRSVNAHRATLRRVFNVLTEKARLTSNVWAKLAKRDIHTQGRRALTVAELQAVCGKATGELRVMLALGLYLGCRLGDAAMMDWENVDLQRHVITYVPRKTARKVGQSLEIPMHPELQRVLEETPKTERSGPLSPDFARRYSTRGSCSTTKPIQAHFIACGLATSEPRKGAGVKRRTTVGFHSLRHTAVSLLRNAGVAQAVSMSIAGHSDMNVHQLYSHSDAEAMRRAVALLPRVSGRVLPAKLPPAVRAEHLQARVAKMAPERVKRAVLRALAAGAKVGWMVAKTV